MNKIKEFNEMSEAMTPQFLPMIMPPMDWDYNPFRGGYYGRKYNQENKADEVVKSIKHNKENIEQISLFEAEIQAIRAVGADSDRSDELFNLERQVASLKASQAVSYTHLTLPTKA